MRKFKLLVLTDHRGHSAENALYAMTRALLEHSLCQWMDVATQGNELNASFFNGQSTNRLQVSRVDASFAFSPVGESILGQLRWEQLQVYDAVWLRMPPPLSADFLDFLSGTFSTQVIINDPKGIERTGTKRFLTRFERFCPPMQVCESVEDILRFKERFPIVLKPFREYGGKGIVRIEGDQVWEGKLQSNLDDFIDRIRDKKIEYLGVKFLKNVTEGDKRIVVVNGKVMGASLRLPAKDSWLCNVAMGGSSNFTEVDEDEMAIVQGINPTLFDMGVLMYGVDTLVGDDGKRVLSEINTTSIGGLPQIANLTGLPLLEETADLVWKYVVDKS